MEKLAVPLRGSPAVPVELFSVVVDVGVFVLPLRHYFSTHGQNFGSPDFFLTYKLSIFQIKLCRRQWHALLKIEHIMASKISNREQSLMTSVQRVSCYVVLLFKERVSFGGIRGDKMQGGIKHRQRSTYGLRVYLLRTIILV